MTEPRWLTAEESKMWRGYTEMHRDLDRVLDQQLIEAKLSNADYQLLVPLSEHPDQRIRARDLALTVSWDRSRLSHQLKRMEQRGLVVKTDCPTDARGTFISLTPVGRQAVEAAAPGHVDAVRRYFVDLMTPEEVATLARIADRVVTRIREAGAACPTEAEIAACNAEDAGAS